MGLFSLISWAETPKYDGLHNTQTKSNGMENIEENSQLMITFLKTTIPTSLGTYILNIDLINVYGAFYILTLYAFYDIAVFHRKHLPLPSMSISIFRFTMQYPIFIFGC